MQWAAAQMIAGLPAVRWKLLELRVLKQIQAPQLLDCMVEGVPLPPVFAGLLATVHTFGHLLCLHHSILLHSTPLLRRSSLG